MSGELVVDASVVIKWFLPESHSDEALSLLQPDAVLLAPEMMHAEVGNVLWKHRRQGHLRREEAEALLADVLGGDVTVYPTNALAPLAMSLACRLDRSFYDSLYLALACSRDCPFVTADRRLVRAVQDHGHWPGQVRWIGEFKAA